MYDISKYENHPSVTKIRNKETSSATFFFSLVEEKEIEKTMRNLNERKACQKSDIPLRIIEENIDMFIKFPTSSFVFFFLSGFSFTDTDNSQDNRGRERTIFYSTVPLPPAHEERWLSHMTYLLPVLMRQ